MAASPYFDKFLYLTVLIQVVLGATLFTSVKIAVGFERIQSEAKFSLLRSK